MVKNPYESNVSIIVDIYWKDKFLETNHLVKISLCPAILTEMSDLLKKIASHLNILCCGKCSNAVFSVLLTCQKYIKM